MGKILGMDGKPIKNSNRPVVTFEDFAASIQTQFPDVTLVPLQDEKGQRAIGIHAGGLPVALAPGDTAPETIMQIAAVAQKAYEAGFYVAMGGKPETKGEGDETKTDPE